MHRPFLVGDSVYLRPLEAADLEGPYLSWLNDPEVTRFMESGAFPTTLSALRRYAENVADAPDTVMLAIIEKTTDTHVGNIKPGPIHWIHRRADLGIMIGERARWGRGYGREAVRLVLAYGFDRLNLNKITLGVDADHGRAVRLYEGLGFKVEGTEREHRFRDGAYHDNVLMAILRADHGRAGTAGR